MIKMIKAIIFDFDGVIAQSNNVKTEAFVELFCGYPVDIRGAIKKFHLRNGGMSRFDKFRYIYANIIQEALSQERFGQLCRDFSELVAEKVINAPLVEGVEDFLKNNTAAYKLYIVSGTPDEEIKEIVKRRMLDAYFLGVYGSGATKKELIENILRQNNFSPQEVVYLGDSINDYEGAVGAGVEFVAMISGDLEADPFAGANLKTKIEKIEEFQAYLDRRKEGDKV